MSAGQLSGSVSCRVRTAFALMVVLATSAAVAQAQSSTTEFDRVGRQPNRDYLNLQPFERLDTLNGNVIITLPIFTLPGNGGRDLSFELTYNANVAVDLVPWTFGVRGVPMRVKNNA